MFSWNWAGSQQLGGRVLSILDTALAGPKPCKCSWVPQSPLRISAQALRASVPTSLRTLQHLEISAGRNQDSRLKPPVIPCVWGTHPSFFSMDGGKEKTFPTPTRVSLETVYIKALSLHILPLSHLKKNK